MLSFVFQLYTLSISWMYSFISVVAYAENLIIESFTCNVTLDLKNWTKSNSCFPVCRVYDPLELLLWQKLLFHRIQISICTLPTPILLFCTVPYQFRIHCIRNLSNTSLLSSKGIFRGCQHRKWNDERVIASLKFSWRPSYPLC